MKHVEVFRDGGPSQTRLTAIVDDVVEVRQTRRGVRLRAQDGTITFIPWSVISRLTISKVAAK